MNYADAVFRATHNSYSGDDRGSVRDQLKGGVRLLELDFHSSDYREHGYRLGHTFPGTSVELGDGNPGELRLERWLETIAAWSDETPGHTPVAVLLDPKGDLTGPDSYADGNLAALNAHVRDAFGARLFPAGALGADEPWPDVADLRGRVIGVLSGSLATRRGYIGDGGREPAVAAAGGRVVELHSSRQGDLWYWSGRLADGGVTWERHGLIGPGRSPAVALRDDGLVLAVHAGAGSDLSYRLGLLAGPDVQWGGRSHDVARVAAARPNPAVRIIGGDRVRATFDTDYGRMAIEGTLRPDTVGWEQLDVATAADAAFHAEDAGAVRVLAVPHQNGEGELLLYGTDAVPSAPIAYEQLLFVEGQWADNEARLDIPQARFAGILANPGVQLDAWRARKRLIRLWKFGEDETGLQPPPNFPATDHPAARWYTNYAPG